MFSVMASESIIFDEIIPFWPLVILVLIAILERRVRKKYPDNNFFRYIGLILLSIFIFSMFIGLFIFNSLDK